MLLKCISDLARKKGILRQKVREAAECWSLTFAPEVLDKPEDIEHWFWGAFSVWGPKGNILCQLIISLFSWHPWENLNPASYWSGIRSPLRTEPALPHMHLHTRNLRPKFRVVSEFGHLRHLTEGYADSTWMNPNSSQSSKNPQQWSSEKDEQQLIEKFPRYTRQQSTTQNRGHGKERGGIRLAKTSDIRIISLII